MLLEFNNNIATIKNTTLEELSQFMEMSNVNQIDSVVINMVKEEPTSESKLELVETPKDDKVIDKPIGFCPRTYNKEFKDKVLKDLKAGKDLNDVSYKYDIPYNTLYTWKRRYLGYKTKRKLSVDISDYDNWRKDLYNYIEANNGDIKQTFMKVYSMLTKVYGVSFDQLSKDFKYKYDRKETSTIELVYFWQYECEHGEKERWGSLFENLMVDNLVKKGA